MSVPLTLITRHGVPSLYKCVYCFKYIVGFIYQIQVSFQLNCSERSVANIQKLTGKLSHGVSAGDGEEQVDRLHTEEYKNVGYMIVKYWSRIMPRSLGRRKVTWYPMSVLAWASQEHGDLCKVCPLQKELLELSYLKGNCQPLYSMGGT